MVAASVQITGAWHGALVIFCPATLARRVASVMFGITPDETSGELIQDALGELANIIAGGVKALIPGTCMLTLPTVADGAVFTLRIRGSYVVSEVGFECEGHPFRVSLLAKSESDGAKAAADAVAGHEERVDHSTSAIMYKRDFSRVPINLEVEIAVDGRHISTGGTRDLSLSGIFSACEEGPSPGTSCCVRLYLGERSSGICIEAVGEIARVDDGGIGIAFSEIIGADSFHHLRQLVLLNSQDPDAVQQELDTHVGIKPLD